MRRSDIRLLCAWTVFSVFLLKVWCNNLSLLRCHATTCKTTMDLSVTSGGFQKDPQIEYCFVSLKDACKHVYILVFLFSGITSS